MGPPSTRTLPSPLCLPAITGAGSRLAIMTLKADDYDFDSVITNSSGLFTQLHAAEQNAKDLRGCEARTS